MCHEMLNREICKKKMTKHIQYLSKTKLTTYNETVNEFKNNQYISRKSSVSQKKKIIQ